MTIEFQIKVKLILIFLKIIVYKNIKQKTIIKYNKKIAIFIK